MGVLGWIILIVIAYLIIDKLNQLIKVNKGDSMTKEEQEAAAQEQQKKYELRQQLERAVGSRVEIAGLDLVAMISANYNNTGKLIGTIISLDEDWLELSTQRKKQEITLFVKVAAITDISILL